MNSLVVYLDWSNDDTQLIKIVAVSSTDLHMDVKWRLWWFCLNSISILFAFVLRASVWYKGVLWIRRRRLQFWPESLLRGHKGDWRDHGNGIGLQRPAELRELGRDPCIWGCQQARHLGYPQRELLRPSFPSPQALRSPTNRVIR